MPIARVRYDAQMTYSVELERSHYEALPPTDEEQEMVQAASASFVGDDDDDWDALLPAE